MVKREGFARYIETVRTTHARKRNLMRLLSRTNWGQVGSIANR
jgi:hypothetical protein